MSALKEIKSKIKNNARSSDITADVYKKISSCGANQFYAVKPAYYIGAVYPNIVDYIDYVDKLLKVKEKEFSEFFKVMIYLRETSRDLLAHITSLGEPTEILIQHLEEIYESEEYEEEEGDEEYVEEEYIERESLKQAPAEKNEEESAGNFREDFAKEKEDLSKLLRARLGEVCKNDNLVSVLSDSISLLYLECMQFIRELARLNRAPDGDIAAILSIFIDLQFGLDVLIKRYISEDMTKDEEYNFDLGFLIWSAHFLNELTEKLNKVETRLIASLP